MITLTESGFNKLKEIKKLHLEELKEINEIFNPETREQLH